MKKRIKRMLVLLMTAALMISMFSVGALAEGEAETSGEASGDGTQSVSEDVSEVQAEAAAVFEEDVAVIAEEDTTTVTVITSAGGELTSGHYILESDVTLSTNLTVAEGATVTIDLNGYTLTGKNTTAGSVITVTGNLVVKDDSDEETGVITNGTSYGTYISSKYYGSGVYVTSGGSLTLEGGTISGSGYSKTNIYGGGIGANSNVIIGSADGETTSVTVIKTWDDSDDADNIRPESVTVNLYNTVNGTAYLIDTATLSEANGWTCTFDELPVDEDYSYSVAEEVPTGYTAEYSDLSGSISEGYEITITNVYEPADEEIEDDTDDTDDTENTDDTGDTDDTEDVEDVEASDTGDPGVMLWIALLGAAAVCILIGRKKIAK